MKQETAKSLHGARVAITRPTGSGTAMARRVRALGGIAIPLPGSRLCPIENPTVARGALQAALRAEFLIFTSPAAVRFARRLAALRARARVIAPGTGTALALKRAGLRKVAVPARADSEGVLDLPDLRRVRGRSVGIVGAPGGRDLLQRELAKRGATVRLAHVYRREPARLDRRHLDALSRGHGRLYVPLSSAETLRHLLENLPDVARGKLLAGTAVASSARLQTAAEDAGFARVLRAVSALDGDLIAAILAAHVSTGRRSR